MRLYRRSDLSINSKGKAAERTACRYLKQQGLQIIATNYRTPQGEIDIIARDRGQYVFVEVRLRSASSYCSASESITSNKQRRIVLAATHYLQQNGLWENAPCRFDAVCLDQHTGDRDYRLKWLTNAFHPN